MQPKPKCNLIIDSCCDLPFAVVNREGVTILPYPYIGNDGEHKDDMYHSITPHDFYQSMRDGNCPSTTQVTLEDCQRALVQAAQDGTPTVFLSFSSGLSGSFDLACVVLEQVKQDYPEAEIYAVDTKLASVAEGLLVYEALRQRENGLTACELAQWAEEARNFVNEIFMVEDLTTLHRGGRIPASVAFAGGKLDVKPLLNISSDGKLSLIGVARGRKKGLKQMVEYYQKRASEASPEQCVIIGDADCPKDVERLVDMMKKAEGDRLFLECNIGPVIGSHVGPGMIALVFWGTDKREELSVADRIARKIKSER